MGDTKIVERLLTIGKVVRYLDRLAVVEKSDGVIILVREI